MRVPVTETPAPLLSYLVVLVNKLIRQNRWGSHGVFPEITRRFNQYDTNDFDNFIPMSSKNCCYKTGMFLCIVNSSVLSLPLFYHDVRQALNPCSCSSVCATTNKQHVSCVGFQCNDVNGGTGPCWLSSFSLLSHCSGSVLLLVASSWCSPVIQRLLKWCGFNVDQFLSLCIIFESCIITKTSCAMKILCAY
jgi:hypothetical protein